MKLLITGNSQAGALRRAVRLGRSVEGLDTYFYVTPGSIGPYLSVRDDGGLDVTWHNQKAPPYVFPESAGEMKLPAFDAVLVSALGFTDGGVRFASAFAQGPIVPDFNPVSVEAADALCSRACFGEVHRETLMAHAGFQFARALRASFAGPILVQPTPYPVASVQDGDVWEPRRRYHDALGYHHFVQTLTDTLLAEFCESNKLVLLPRPLETLVGSHFCKPEFVRESDGVHSTEAYGALVLAQVRDLLVPA